MTRSDTVISFAVIGLGLTSVLLAQMGRPTSGSPTSEPPLIQTEHITGDQYQGFRTSCLIVYSDARYHRERRRQVSQNGHAQDAWESPEVFESQLDAKQMERLRATVEAPGFRSISGTVGNLYDLNSMVMFAPLGVIPHTSIEILTASIARPNQPQVFEVTETRVAQRQEPLRAFLEWVKDTEGSQAARLAASAANNCSSLVGHDHAAIAATEMPTGILAPILIYTRAPRLPPNSPTPRPVIVELVINPDGTVATAALKDRASPDVAQSVLNAVRMWRFHPGRLLGIPVAMRMQVRVPF